MAANGERPPLAKRAIDNDEYLEYLRESRGESDDPPMAATKNRITAVEEPQELHTPATETNAPEPSALATGVNARPASSTDWPEKRLRVDLGDDIYERAERVAGLTASHPTVAAKVWELLSEPALALTKLTEFYQSLRAKLGRDKISTFPQWVMEGSLGELARELSKGTEVPEEFIFATALTCFGAIASEQLTLKVGMDSDTRLFTVLLGKSASAKKSSAMARTIEFFRKLNSPIPWIVNYGVGSAEGLAKEFTTHNRILLAYDELRSFTDKTKVQASVLLPMIASLFEKYSWDNTTKTGAVSVRNARLSLVGCCTTETYEHLWTSEAIAIGMLNRLFVVDADAKPKVAWPSPPDQAVLEELRARIQQQFARLPITFDIAPDAKLLWGDWYRNLPASEHAKRLDTIGLRLMPILALTMDKPTIDTHVMEHVTAMLDYELNLRALTDPIDADDRIARMEEKIRRNLKAKGPLTKRELRQSVHADRDGLWAFKTALTNLADNEDITLNDGKYSFVQRAENPA
jgi:hypothetical protein